MRRFHSARRFRPGRGLLASVVVCLCLLALLVVPLVTQRSVRQRRDEIQEAADPARTLVTLIQYRLARQMSALRGFLISGDPEYLRRFEESAALEAAVYAQLEPLARRLGQEPLIRFVELRGRSRQWHEALNEVVGPDGVIRDAGDESPFEQEQYLAALDAATAFDEAVAEATRQRRAEMEVAENRMLVAQVGVVLLALLAAGLTGWLGWRVERLAVAAEARRHEAEEALASTARAVEGKARLIRGITHDVRNPLSAADGYAELLEMGLKGELAPQQVAVVSKIRSSIHGALNILEDLLELSRAEAGELAVQRGTTSLLPLVREVVEEWEGAAHAAGHRVELHLPAGAVLAHTDGDRVRQILGNLMSNALKYTPPPGRVVVEVHCENDPDSGVPRWAVVRVADSGPGVRAADRERIFQEFTRLSSSGATGHGLGLAISRRIAALLGGELALESEAGEGSVFVLRLPTHADPPSGAPRAVV